MNKTAFAFSAMLAFAGIGFGQDIQIKDQKALFYAYLECTGSYQQIAAKIPEFMEAYFGQGLTPPGALFALYFNNPAQVPEADLRWRIGMAITKDDEPAAPLKKDVFDFSKIASFVHVGPYEKVGESYARMAAYIEKNGWKLVGPVMEIYLDNPQEVAPEKLRTEIVMPIEKK